MIEKLVENWLANTGERGYETPFAQLLTAEGLRVIQGPVHHPFEHGKDILALTDDGRLFAYQLKGPDLTNLEEFEKIQGQLMALAGTAITHPAISPPRRPDRVFLVTNATLTPPVRDRIEKFNLANNQNAWPPIEPVERDQLLARFIAAHGKFLPQTLPEIRNLLELYYSDPRPPFPVRVFATYLTHILPFPPQQASGQDCKRAVASAALLTSYAASSWTGAENHLSVAQAWLTLCATLIRLAAVHNLAESMWLGSYELAFEAARTSLASLSREAADATDLLVPGIVEGIAYPARSLLVCGMLSAYFLSERTLAATDTATTNRIGVVLSREAKFAKLVGECDVPLFLVLACALEQLGEMRRAERMMLLLVHTLSKQNQRGSLAALPDPYHDTEQVLLRQVGADSDLDGEQFDGRSYTLHIAIEWVARRLWRRALATMWPDITRVQFYEFQPSSPECYLAVDDDEGELKIWSAGQPQSWARLLAQSTTLDRSKLPNLLWAHREMLPYLPLLLPYRLTATLAGAIDELASNPR